MLREVAVEGGSRKKEKPKGCGGVVDGVKGMILVRRATWVLETRRQSLGKRFSRPGILQGLCFHLLAPLTPLTLHINCISRRHRAVIVIIKKVESAESSGSGKALKKRRRINFCVRQPQDKELCGGGSGKKFLECLFAQITSAK